MIFFFFFLCLCQVSDEAKKFASSKTLNLKSEVAAGTCQACSRYPELAKYIEGVLPTSFDWREWGAVTKVKNQVRGLLEDKLDSIVSFF